VSIEANTRSLSLSVLARLKQKARRGAAAVPPLGAGEAIVECASGASRLALGIDVQHDLSDFFAVGPFGVRVQEARVGNGVIVWREDRIRGRRVHDIGIEGSRRGRLRASPHLPHPHRRQDRAAASACGTPNRSI
jgi:hypothetical protein